MDDIFIFLNKTQKDRNIVFKVLIYFIYILLYYTYYLYISIDNYNNKNKVNNKQLLKLN